MPCRTDCDGAGSRPDAAKVFGALAQRIGQPAVLGELIAEVVLDLSVLGLVDPQTDVLHLFDELGVIILLFEIGLETNLHQLLRVGGTVTVVALVRAALPFAFGYAVCWGLGFDPLVAIVAGPPSRRQVWALAWG